MPKLIRLLPVITFLIFHELNSDIPAGEPELGRVQSEWPAAARRLDERFARVKGNARLWRDARGDSANSLMTEARFAIDHGMEKVELLRSARRAKPIELGLLVYCVGKDTAFQLSRQAGNDRFVVKGIGTTPSERSGYLSVFGRFLHAHHGVVGRSMTRFLESPGFEITGAEAVEISGKTLMRVNCEYGPRAPKEQVSLVLDPEAGWVVRSCQYRPSIAPDRLFNFEIEYGPDRSGVLLPRLVTLDLPDGLHHCEFTNWEFAPTPISEFSMTHYGLPDMVHASRPRNTLPYWLAGLAALVGAIAFTVRRIASGRFRSARV